MNDKRSLAEKAADAEQRLKERTREAHEAIADLNSVLKQVKDYGPELVRSLLEEEVRKQLAVMNDEVKEHIEKASEAVLRRFDTLAAVLLGENKRARGNGREKYSLTIPELVEQIVAERDALESRRGESP